MPYLYDPLRATLAYRRSFDPGDRDSLGGSFGTVIVNGENRLRTWEIDASRACFEADPCSCGVEGCGLRDVHVHRSGPFIVWTCWLRRHDEPDSLGDLPLLFPAEGYQAALGGAIDGLPELDGVHARELIEGPPLRADAVWWWDEGPDTDDFEIDALVRLLADLPAAALDAASLAPWPDAPWHACNESGEELRVALIDGELAVHLGPLSRFPVMLRIPGLLASVQASPRAPAPQP